MIARVTLEIALRKEFDYRIPPELVRQVDVGTRVQVPFGPRKVLGVVTAMAEESAHAHLKPILKIIGTPSLVTPQVLALARWISDYYCCPLELSLKSVLPEAVRREAAGWRERLLVRALPLSGELPPLPKRQLAVWTLLQERPEIALQELLERAATTSATVRRLEDRGLVAVTSEISERDPYGHEIILPTTSLAMNPAQARALAAIVAASAAPRPEVRGAKAHAGGPGSATGTTAGLVPPSATFLLHGVTGSGKTEVYLQALAYALERGKGGIVLVPEISLTPQTVERFKARFSSGPLRTLVAVLHSHLSAGERHDEWHKIRQGRARVVIGARSAIFAPVDPLGLIIVDEEHEHTYKQEEAPRYHARDVAVVRGQREGAVVVLGSATPSLESYYNCKQGKYTLLELPERADNARMPHIRVVDLRQASHKGGGPPIFSPQLKEAMHQRLERGEQTILFLNRRGYSSALECPQCGYVAQCPNCSVSLTYHRREQKLACHICGHTAPVPSICPTEKCRNPKIRYPGMGTEKVEETLAKIFPRARIRRMDSDVMKRKEDYRRVLGDFRVGKIDILVGTQMIAKGLHFPNVTLVGIIYADMALHQPDFRAGERTFQLITQVAGRAGRGDLEGEVFVQAFTPFHPAIQLARRHDFAGFYEQELEFREPLKYPPFSRIALLILKGRNEEKVKFSADYLRKELDRMAGGGEPANRRDAETGNRGDGETAKDAVDLNLAPAADLADSPVRRFAGSPLPNPLRDLVICGPAPAPLVRAETFYRYHIMLRTRQMSQLSRRLAQLTAELSLPEDVTLAVDIDPVDLA